MIFKKGSIFLSQIYAINHLMRNGSTLKLFRKEVEFIDMKGKNFLFSLEGPIQYGYDLKVIQYIRGTVIYFHKLGIVNLHFFI